MSEVILPPIETEPELPEEQLPEVDKPTELSKVITVKFNPLDTGMTSTANTRQSFYTTDTDAWIVFEIENMDAPNGEYSLVLYNKSDGSIFQRTGDIISGAAYYKIEEEEIKHAGDWVGQVVITLANGKTTTSRFSFNVAGHLLDGKDVRQIVIQDFETLMKQLEDLKNSADIDINVLKSNIEEAQRLAKESEIARQEKFEVNESERIAAEDERKQAELQREETYDSKVDAAIVEADVVTKVDDKVAELSPTIQNVTAQLAQTPRKTETGWATLNTFDEPTRASIQGLEPGEINAVLGEGNVHPENTSFLYPSPENIYNFETNKDGFRFGNNGVEIADATYSASDYIKVTTGKYIIGFPDSVEPVAVQRITFYDKAKAFKSIISQGSSFTSFRVIEVDVPEDGYIRIPSSISQKTLLVVSRAENFDGFHTFSWNQNIKSPPRLDSVGKEELKDESVGVDKTTFITKAKNLFNKKDVTLDTLYSTAPATTILKGYYTLNSPVFLTKGTYTIQKVRQWLIYSTNGIILENNNTGDNNANVTFTIDENANLYISGSVDNIDVTQIEEGSTATSISEYGHEFSSLKFTKEQIESLKTEHENKEQDEDINVIKKGETFTLISDFSDSEKISIVTERHSSRNKAFNFVRTEVNGVKIHDNSDDITPIRTFTTVGANHGYTTIAIVKMAGHGKVTADLGSKWTDGTTEYTLLLIEGDNLTFGCPYTVGDNEVISSLRSLPKSNLNHVSGAKNTSLINVSTTNTGQLYPSINKITVKYLLDGKEIKEDGTFYGDELQIIEKYNVMDYKSIIDFAQANIGVSYANDTIEGIVQISNTFTFTKGLKNTTSHGLKALKNVKLGRCGFLQAIPINLSGHTRKRFMPNVKVKDGIDFEKGVDLNSYTSDLVFTNEDNKNIGIPPNHVIDWLYDSNGNKKYGFTIGYIPDKTNSKNQDRIVNSANTWDMRGTTKIYPIAVEGKLLLAGDYMNFEGYRNYLTAEEVGEATNLNVVRDKKDAYLFANFNTQVKGISKELNNEIGKEVVNVQSENIELKNDVVDSNGVVISSISDTSNGVFKVQ